MEKLSRKIYNKPQRPLKVLQFGEGNFLRAFVDWILQQMNDKNLYNGDAVIVQLTVQGRAAELNSQDGLYTLYLQGIQNKKTVSEKKIIDVCAGAVNPYVDYKEYLKYAECPDLEIIVSNSTEAGIAFDPSDTDFTQCPKSFPGKLLAFLFARYKHFNGSMDKGLGIIPCELIDNNGQELLKILIMLAKSNGMDEKFIEWIQKANHFTDTLVDRIVPGYPAAEIEKIKAECGYEDISVVKGEIFHLWVLKKNEFIQKKFPADKAGLNVIFASDITPYKQRKVKILNGSHTALVPVAYLMGIDTVGEAVDTEEINRFLNGLIFNEINPTIDLPKKELNEFALDTIERFKNPFIRHELMSIALNSTTKFKTRLLPTLEDYINKMGTVPKHLSFALAAFVLFNKGKRGEENIALKDSPEYLQKWTDMWQRNEKNLPALIAEVCRWTDLWEKDLTKLHKGLTVQTAEYLEKMVKIGVKNALKEFLKDNG